MITTSGKTSLRPNNKTLEMILKSKTPNVHGIQGLLTDFALLGNPLLSAVNKIQRVICAANIQTLFKQKNYFCFMAQNTSSIYQKRKKTKGRAKKKHNRHCSKKKYNGQGR